MSNVKCILNFFLFSRSLLWTFLARIQNTFNFSEADKKVKEIRKTKRMTRDGAEWNKFCFACFLLFANAKNLPNFNFSTAEKATETPEMGIKWRCASTQKEKRALKPPTDLSIKKKLLQLNLQGWNGRKRRHWHGTKLKISSKV